MNGDSSFAKGPGKNTLKSEKINKVFEEISNYFSESQWEKLSYSDKITWVYLKRNYITMSSLGLRAFLPTFRNNQKKDNSTPKDNSGETSSHGTKVEPETTGTCPKEPKNKGNDQKIVAGAPEEQAGRVKSRPEEASTSGKKNPNIPDFKRGDNVWSHRLHERKNFVVYEEISEPEEEEDN
ncbi:protein SSX3 [Fukomys damarensis]|uniref:protein SSX3 n=1 Tax=Fukomys damarensis TaxID=885580 RepID=UPI00053F962F|nr:protein SSX3 [Fukomys damarensis]